MLDSETKRRIDAARDILVGKVPDPKSQVEQITIALVYKFMDDIDQESVELGGKASFFTGEYEKFAWSRIFDPHLGGYDMLALYSEAITRMATNPNLPQLFRNIFKNAFLPYRDPETLRLFLKTINEFQYDHSERLGDAFEYLLSVLGSQGDAGQFRTPRHLIDFMVEIIQPQKGETILDPACGTAGFLISAYKYILRRNSNGNTLTLQERDNLFKNFKGYDISPDMVRLSLVNLYLHGFQQPQIYEYDTLTSEERWNDYADVILANPPFMSPTGGIRPHKRFSVQSKRSEVLFVDYIAEHLTPNGRAAVIVPEGIIFQSGTAYKQLRKYLVEQNYLWGVVSLPAGMFNPYSGVKTSILLLDRALAKKTDAVLFVKIEADGFDLGAQRKPIERDDFPVAIKAISEYQTLVRAGCVEIKSQAELPENFLIVSKSKIETNSDYSFSSDRYLERKNLKVQKYETVKLGEVCEIISGQSPEGEYYNETGDGIPFYQGKTEFTEKFLGEPRKWTTQTTRIAEMGDILMSVRAPVGPVNISTQRICIGRGLAAIRPDTSKIHLEFLFSYLQNIQDDITGNSGAVFPSINRNDLAKIQIPLPPLEVQREIVTEIEGYQRIIDGARQVVDNWKPNIELELEEERKAAGVAAWEMVKLEDVCEKVLSGGTPSTANEEFWNGTIPWISSADIIDIHNAIPRRKITEEAIKNSATNLIPEGNIIVVTRVGLGKLFLNNFDVCISQDSQGLIINKEKIDVEYLLNILLKKVQIFKTTSQGSTIQGVTKSQLLSLELELPPLSNQHEIIKRIKIEREIVESNRRLIAAYQVRIQKVIQRVWEG